MNYTENHKLCQWEASDPIRRADFNADNAAIDAAIKTVEQNAANALSAYKSTNDAAVAALRSAANTERVVVGSYTGNGTTSRTITLGFTPKCVIQLGYINSGGAVSITADGVCRYITYNSCGDTSNTGIVENGFQTAKAFASWHNEAGKTEYYIAFC